MAEKEESDKKVKSGAGITAGGNVTIGDVIRDQVAIEENTWKIWPLDNSLSV